jgi:hypothetical protein
MADLIYCGTNPPVGAARTQQLLVGPFAAIWCPPMRLPFEPSEEDKLWLVWRSPDAALLLLGGGRVRVTDDGHILWNNRTLPGVRPAAVALGYPGPRPTNMTFLHLSGVVASQGQPPVNIDPVSPGLNAATPLQAQLLTQILPIS